MSNSAGGDEFQDAVESTASTSNGLALVGAEGGENDEKTFDVSHEELSLIRAKISETFPEDYENLSDGYICSVASKPYSKDPTVRRPVEYSTEKLNDLMAWRKDNVLGLEGLLELVSDAETGKENSEAMLDDPDKFAKAKALAACFNYGSMYWHGLDRKGRPILWIRCNRLPWYPDVEAQVNMLILLADIGIKLMPEGITDFVVVSDSSSPPPPHPQYMINVLQALSKGFPDRLNVLVSCPVGTIIQMVMKVLLPLMPGRLAGKILLLTEDETKPKLDEILMNGMNDIPTFLGGTCNHEVLYPTEGTYPERTLKFDHRGMIRRLEKAIKDHGEEH